MHKVTQIFWKEPLFSTKKCPMACDSRVYDAFHPGGVPSPYGESEGREEGGERGERDVDDYAPAVLAFLGHNGFGWFGGFMSRSLRLM